MSYNEQVAADLKSMFRPDVPDFSLKIDDWELDLVKLSQVKPQAVDWRWTARLPVGKLQIIAGDPEAGKTFLTLAMTTAITLGSPIPPDPEPPEPYEPRNVLLLSAEDGVEDTLAPRMAAMGANMDRVTILRSLRKSDGSIRMLDLGTDLWRLHQALEKGDYGYVVIDPINAYTPDVDSKGDVSVRGMLAPIAELVDRHRLCISLIRHLNKNEQAKAIYRPLDSIGYTAAARVVLLVGKNPDDEEERIVLVQKNNLAKKPKAMAFDMNNGIFHWRGESDLTADQLLSNRSEDEKSAVDEAGEFMMDLIDRGEGSVAALFAKSQTQQNGFSDATVRRAKAKYKIKSVKEGAQWNWIVVPK